MSHECPAWRGEIGAYIVGALDVPAATAVADHMAICAGCSAEYHELLSVRRWLSKLRGWRCQDGAHAHSAVRCSCQH